MSVVPDECPMAFDGELDGVEVQVVEEQRYVDHHLTGQVYGLKLVCSKGLNSASVRARQGEICCRAQIAAKRSLHPRKLSIQHAEERQIGDASARINGMEYSADSVFLNRSGSRKK